MNLESSFKMAGSGVNILTFPDYFCCIPDAVGQSYNCSPIIHCVTVADIQSFRETAGLLGGEGKGGLKRTWPVRGHG